MRRPPVPGRCVRAGAPGRGVARGGGAQRGEGGGAGGARPVRRPGGAGFRRRSAGGPGCDPVRPAGRWGSGLTHGRAPGVCRAGRGAGRRRAGGGERAGGRLPCAGREPRRGRGEPGSAVPEKAPAGRSGAFPREAPQQSGWSGSEVLGREGPLTACFPSRERDGARQPRK